MSGVYIVCGLLAACAVLVLIIRIQCGRIKRGKAENAALRNEIKNMAARLEHIRGYIQKSKIAMEEANENRRELERTPDGGLAGRANNLFGCLRDRPGGGGNGTSYGGG